MALTDRTAFRLPILQALAKSGGSQKLKYLYSEIGRIMANTLTDDDRRNQRNKRLPEPKWHTAVRAERDIMANHLHPPLLKPIGQTSRGIWEWTEDGRKYYEERTPLGGRPHVAGKTNATGGVKRPYGPGESTQSPRIRRERQSNPVNRTRKTKWNDSKLLLAKSLETAVEGDSHMRFVTTYERDAKLRASAIEIHGSICYVCGFDFGEFYGDIGVGFTHIHHIEPISTLAGPVSVDPRTDLVPVCANCHSMIHRRRDRTLSVEELKRVIATQKSQKQRARLH